MTNKPDIIGIVKELQKESERLHGTVIHATVAEAERTLERHHAALRDNFPAIADALLVAVEGLEIVIAACQPEDDEDPHGLMEPDEIAKAVLAKIRNPEPLQEQPGPFIG